MEGQGPQLGCSDQFERRGGGITVPPQRGRVLRSAGRGRRVFIVLRPAPSGTRLLLSDATAAIDYDIAADVLDALNIEVPDIDPDDLDDVEPWEEGDLSLLADLRLPEPVLAVITAETDLYPDEQLGMIAQRLGFTTELSGFSTNFRDSSRPVTLQDDERMIRVAIEAARAATDADVPVGAVVFDADGVEVSRAVNSREAMSDPTAHAEIMALREAARVYGDGWRLEGTTLAVTLEPCTMCAGALVLARVSRVVFGAWEPKTGAVGSLWDVVRDRRLTHRPQVRGGVLEDECADPRGFLPRTALTGFKRFRGVLDSV